MFKNIFLLLTISLLSAFQSVYGEQAAGETLNTPASNDHRLLASLPEQSRELMRLDMLNHLSALNEIIGYLAISDFNAAADVAEKRMGKSSMGKHRASGMGPGRYMPLEMRNIGWSMHEAATDFANIAKQGDVKETYIALQKITSACVACHYSYRTR